MTTLRLHNATAREVDADAIVVGVVAGPDGGLMLAPGADEVAAAYGTELPAILSSFGASAKAGDVAKLPAPAGARVRLALAAGLGDGGEDEVRRAAGAAARALSGNATVAFALGSSDPGLRATAEGALLGTYGFDRYLAAKHEPVSTALLLTDRTIDDSMSRVLDQATVVADAVNFTRDLVNEPPNALYPESFVATLERRANGSAVSVAVKDEVALVAEGYGGLMGVGQGSARPPRLATLSYRPQGARAHLALVGKGITFDSGGLSIKPANAMLTMKCDMAGAAAVAAATLAIAALELPVSVTTYLCLAENMPSGTAVRPGDVLTMYGGTTVEVLNTDAEGRLVLADGIATANLLEPDLIVDVATLTGACVVALGTRIAGVFSNDEQLSRDILDAADAAGEPMWPMPIPDEMVEKVKASKVADLSQHKTDPLGGALFAAAFLREFVAPGTRWAHLDIAGPAYNDGEPTGYTPKGGTGAGVRTLVELAQQIADRQET